VQKLLDPLVGSCSVSSLLPFLPLPHPLLVCLIADLDTYLPYPYTDELRGVNPFF
jgi:hypothetical protein